MNSEQRIRALREASNTALKSHDVAGFLKSIDEDYVGTAGNGGHIRSRGELEALVQSLAEERAASVWFVRTPSGIEVDPAGGRALEEGRWLESRRENGAAVEGIGGRYTAFWRRVRGGFDPGSGLASP